MIRKIESWSSGDLKRGQERLKILWRIKVENDMNGLELQNEMVENRHEWRRNRGKEVPTSCHITSPRVDEYKEDKKSSKGYQ